MSNTLVTGWIRAAVAGETLDSRTIDQSQIQQMADSYDPEFYTALIWIEHLRGFHPDSSFNSYGHVVEAKAETIPVGKLKGQLALYIRLAPSAELIKMVRGGQKLFTSVEMHTNMAHIGGAYLMGLAVTDSPASAGTSMMKFSRDQDCIYTPSIGEPLCLQSDFL